MTVVTAKVLDSTHLELSRPIRLPKGGRVIVSVEMEGRRDDEYRDWSRLSVQGMAAAYGNDEPDYPLSTVAEPNPEYRP